MHFFVQGAESEEAFTQDYLFHRIHHKFIKSTQEIL